MTEDEAMRLLKSGIKLKRLPKKFHNKEFVIKFATTHNEFLLRADLDLCGIKTDYDIVLVKCICWRNNGYIFKSKDVIEKNFNTLTDEEINKLWMTLELTK